MKIIHQLNSRLGNGQKEEVEKMIAMIEHLPANGVQMSSIFIGFNLNTAKFKLSTLTPKLFGSSLSFKRLNSLNSVQLMDLMRSRWEVA